MWLRILRWGSSGWALNALTVLRGRQGETWPHRQKRRKARGNRAARAWRSREAGAEGGAVSHGQRATQLWRPELARKQSPPESWPWQHGALSPVKMSHTYDLWNCQSTHTQFMPPSLGKFATAASGNAYAVLHSALVLSRHTTLTSTGFCRPLL